MSLDAPFIPFRFRIEFFQTSADGSTPDSAKPLNLCGAAFSEVSGLEATMEPKVIRQGGAYDGELQRPGQITYATVILKRGMTTQDHMWNWWRLVADGKTASRLKAVLIHEDHAADGKGGVKKIERLRWEMKNALPTKFKAATYSGTASDVGIEELHFVHEGLTLVPGEGGT